MTSDQGQSQSQDPTQPPKEQQQQQSAHADDTISFDALSGVPSMEDGDSMNLMMPGGLSFGNSTGSSSLDEQIQAFTAGLASTLGASSDGAGAETTTSTTTAVVRSDEDAAATLTPSAPATAEASAMDPLAEYLSAVPSMDVTAMPTPHESFDGGSDQDPNAAVASLLASLGQISQENHQVPGQSQASHLPLADLFAHQTLPQNPAPASTALDPTSPGYIESLLEEASRNAIAEATAAASTAVAPPAALTPTEPSAPVEPPAAVEPAQVTPIPASAPAPPPAALSSSNVTNASINASLEQFMANLHAEVKSSLAAEPSEPSSQDFATAPTTAAPSPAGASSAAAAKPPKLKPPKTPKPAKVALKPPPLKRVLGKRKHREIGPLERKTRVEKALATYLRDIDPFVKPSLVTGPILSTNAGTSKMTTVRCTHASVAQKSYGSEKRFLNPPPIVHVTGPLRRYADWGPAVATSQQGPRLHDAIGDEHDNAYECGLSMLVKGESEELFSNEQVAALDKCFETKVKSLYVTPTGRSKSFRLQLNLLRASSPDDLLTAGPPAKRLKAASSKSPPPSGDGAGNADGDSASNKILSPEKQQQQHAPTGNDHLSRLPSGLSWVSFESAPVTIVSKSSKKTVKPRSSSAQIANGSMISLFNRINSQTARTKYVHTANDGRLTAQNQEWSAFRVMLVSRPPQADLAGAEEGSVTYGSTIILTDITSGASTDPLVVCKMDKGEVMLPQIDPPAEIGLAGSGMRSRRIPVNVDLRGGAALAADSRPISLLAAQKKDAAPGANAAAAPTLSSSPTADGKPATGTAPAASSSSVASPAAVAATGAAAGGTSASTGRSSGEDLNVYGPVGQLQKVALMRFVPRSEADKIAGDSEHLESDFTAPRSYLCAAPPDRWMARSPADAVGREPLATSYVNTHTNGFDSPMLVDDTASFDHHKDGDGNSLTFVSPKTKVVAKEHGPGAKIVDEVDDTYAWSVIGISRFEFSFFDTSATEASKDEGPCEAPITPFPLITSMPTYDQHVHTLSTTVANFVVSAAITADKMPLDVWVGPLGPCACQHSAPPAPWTPGVSGDETLITVKLPSVQAMLDAVQSPNADTPDSVKTASAAATIPPHFLLPLVFVNDSDGTAFHSGRHVVCEDLVQLMKAAGHEADAETLCQLGFGLGEVAGPPKQGAWSVRII